MSRFIVTYIDLNTKKKHTRVFPFNEDEESYNHEEITGVLSRYHEQFNITDVRYVPENYTISCETV